MIDELTLDVEHAEAIVEAGIEFEAYTEDMPDSDADKIEAAHDIVAMAIDSWVDDEVRPDSDDKQVAAAGEQIKTILDFAGIEIDDDGNVEYGELPEFEEGEEEGEEGEDGDDEGVDLDAMDRKELIAFAKENKVELKPRGKSDDEIKEIIASALGEEGDDDTSGDDDEAPFAIDDIISGYDEMKVNEITEAMADLEDDDIAAVKEYEKTEGRKRKQILNFVPDDEAEGAGEEGDDEEGEGIDLDALDRKELIQLAKDQEVFEALKPTRGKSDDDIRAILTEQLGGGDDEEGEDDTSEDGEELGEPWDGYDGSSVKEIKDALEAAKDDEDEPLTSDQVAYVSQYESSREKPRTSLVKWLDALATELTVDDGEAGEAVDEAVAKDDRKDAKKSKSNGTITLTREEIVEALSTGSVTITL